MSYPYTIKWGDRKTLEIRIKDGKIVVYAPWYAQEADVARMVSAQEAWISAQLQKQEALREKTRDIQPLTVAELHRLADEALRVIPERVRHYAGLLGVRYGRVTIRAQKTKWGSCSAVGNLNFNCLLMLAPPEVLDSVVVHELCHLKHMDHSPNFYEEILRVFPDYYRWNGWLKAHGDELMKKRPHSDA